MAHDTSSSGTPRAAAATELRTIYNNKYGDGPFRRIVLYPDRMSTQRYDDVARLVRNERGDLFEFGCGDGQLLIALADRFGRLAGVDLSDRRIARGVEAVHRTMPELAPRLDLRPIAGEVALPFEDDSFDVVLAIAVIEHCVDVFFVMDELARICRPGGAVVVSVPNACYVRNAFWLLLGDIPLTGTHTRDMRYWRECGWDGGHLHQFSKPALDALLRHVGLIPEAWTGDGRLARLRRWHCNLVGSLTVRARKPGGAPAR
ncbi:MAG TPA: class I SAM-dependent methyltransferase [Phycisphaerales bacterium]|nr:class I SAM-dependent methyltransferase [Phycisphaerales bacterium]HMP37685.1 class I SAM-dependent methyltransferase [Phycisphaerales bacterium]